MTKPRFGVLLMNVGTPDSPRVGDVRRYLSQFLGDARVIDLPWLVRKVLVNGLIVPLRAPKSAKLYRKLWTDKGSPLIVNGVALRDALQQKLGEEFSVALAMRYQNPSIEAGIEKLMKAGVERIVLAPLFPQYASSSTGSAMAEAMRVLGMLNDVPVVSTLPPFHADEGYLNAFAERISACAPEGFDHVLFSFHGLPERHIQRSHTSCSDRLQREVSDAQVSGCPCERAAFSAFPSCYKMQCYSTARALALHCGIPEGKWSVSFQSRLDQHWLKPFSDQLVEQFAKQGMKRLLVTSPAFVSDCLETTVEIGDEYAQAFREHGGETLQLVESLNNSPSWVDALSALIQRSAAFVSALLVS